LRLYFQKQQDDKLPPGAVYSSQAPPPKGVQTKTTSGGAEYWIQDLTGSSEVASADDANWHEKHEFSYNDRDGGAATHDGPGWSHNVSFKEALPNGKVPTDIVQKNKDAIGENKTIPLIDEPTESDLKNGLETPHDLNVPGVGHPKVKYSSVFNITGGKRAAIVCEFDYGSGTVGKQAFYRRTGTGGDEGTSDKGDWVPFDGITSDNEWVNKVRFMHDKDGKNLPDHVQRYGNEFNKIVGHTLKELPHNTEMYKNPKVTQWKPLDGHEINQMIGSKYALSGRRFLHCG